VKLRRSRAERILRYERRILEAYLERHRIARISELTGTIDTTARDKEWISS